MLLVEISRRAVDMTFTLVLVGFLLYAYFGQYFPGPIAHKGYDLDRIVGHMYMTLEGIFGVPLAVSVSFVTLFVVYGTFMDVAGAGNFWLELSLAVMGCKSSSAGRGALITTALLGGPQGSGVATTMSVTPVMWPILKKAGYSADMAAGLIAAGGIGAVISPPLMGAAAFLIMQFLNVPYWDVVIMVTVPTLLYYLGTFFMVEIEARKHDFAPPETTGKSAWTVIRTQRLPPHLPRAPRDPPGDGPLARGLGHLGAAGDRGHELHQPGPQRVADPAAHLRRPSSRAPATCCRWPGCSPPPA